MVERRQGYGQQRRGGPRQDQRGRLQREGGRAGRRERREGLCDGNYQAQEGHVLQAGRRWDDPQGN